MAISAIDQKKLRTHVTLAYSGKVPWAVKLPPRSKGQPAFVITLQPGDNEVQLPHFHEFGLHQPTADLIASGVITPVCRDHFFDDEEEHCRQCGHNRESAEAAAFAGTPEGKAQLAQDLAEHNAEQARRLEASKPKKPEVPAPPAGSQ